GPDGRLWVVEMADYPLGLNGHGAPGGRVRILEDRDADGWYETSTLFADRLSTPNGILVWRNGVIVTACPDVLYLEDTTGDGRADHIEKLLTGFAAGNQQHRVNGPRWGLDNWIYLANGDSGGVVRSVKTGQEVDIRGRDLRFRPETGEIETQAGQTQFGRNRDDWGNWFGCNNPNPIFHYALDEHYLKRNPHFAPPPARRDIRDGDTLVYPIGPIISHCDTKYRKIGETPRFTSACGTIVYRDDWFGPEYENVTFTSEPVYNIVHARKLIPQGISFRSEKLHAGEVEFFRSEDPWSRPAATHVGPDGALYVADMVREVIEHPEWIDDELEQTLDVRSGANLGRLYRIAPQGKPRRSVPQLDQLTTIELVAALDSPSGWQRDLVQRMLIWRDDSVAIEPLEQLAINSQSPLARLHALCTLDGMHKLDSEIVIAALRDEHAGVQRHAVRLAEQFAPADDEDRVVAKKWAEALLPLVVNDSSPAFLRLQLAYSLGEFPGEWSSSGLAWLAVAGEDQPDLAAAVQSSMTPEHVKATIRILLQRNGAPPKTLARLSALAIQQDQPDPVRHVLSSLQIGSHPERMLGAWFELLGPQFDVEAHLDRDGQQLLYQLMTKVRLTAEGNGNVSDRCNAINAIGHIGSARSADIELLASLLTPQEPTEVQLAAIDSLANTGREEVPQRLLANWPAHGPVVRESILNRLLQRSQWMHALINAIDQETIAVANLSSVHRQRLLESRDQLVRQLAETLFGKVDQDRQLVLERYDSVLTRLSDEQADAK
ncbi:MAG: hypothetical protein KDA58_15220, partial [Planctomycetaceae bacterium]|nr:hypothetical protein [Planctomycetaceae bacterium]